MVAQGPVSHGGASRVQPQQQLPQKQPNVPEAPDVKFSRGTGMSLILGTNKDFSFLTQTPVDTSYLGEEVLGKLSMYGVVCYFLGFLSIAVKLIGCTPN